MALVDQLKTHAAAILNLEHFGETVTYTPKGGAPKAIVALVHRSDPPDNREETSQAKWREAKVWIRNDATLGIVTPKFQDKINLELRSGAGAVDATVTGILFTNAAFHALEVAEQ